MIDIAQIFEERPKKWKIKGDQFLWEEIRLVFIKHNRDFTVGTFQSSLNGFISGFIIKHGKKISDDIVHIERFPFDSASRGSISLGWWKRKGVPLLVKRFEEKVK